MEGPCPSPTWFEEIGLTRRRQPATESKLTASASFELDFLKLALFHLC